jgi:F-type H+-transporting ATPase subunit a
MLNSIFAIDIHISLKAEKLFTLGPVTVTNSMLYGAIVALCLTLFMVRAAKRISVKPKKGAAGPVEMIVDFILSLVEGPLGSRAAAVKYAPYFATYFLFILFSNLTALLPIVGPGLTLMVGEEKTPLFRPFTADLNGTIALAVIAIVMVQVLSIREQGGKNHLKHYFTDKPLNPINFFIGILEVFGEFTRMISLSLRLFLNTAVGEILVSVFTSMIIAGGRTPLAVLPIILFEVLVAGIQAYVFTVLAATYLGLATAHHAEHASHSEDAHESVPLKKVEEH